MQKIVNLCLENISNYPGKAKKSTGYLLANVCKEFYNIQIKVMC